MDRITTESWACILGNLWGQVATRTRSVTSAYFRRVSKSACDKNWLYSTPTKKISVRIAQLKLNVRLE